MTTVLDGLLPDQVYDLIQEYGKDLTFINNAGDSVYDPKDGGAMLPAAASFVVKCSPPQVEYTQRQGDTTATGVMRTYVPAANLDATLKATHMVQGCRVEFDSQGWILNAIAPIYSGELVAVYRIDLSPTSTEVLP